jgi:hypothetical protein
VTMAELEPTTATEARPSKTEEKAWKDRVA